MTSKRDVEVALTDYKNKLTLDWKEDCVMITKGYVGGEKGKEEWSEINTLVRELGGHWVSLGKDSHWVVPLEEEEKQQDKVEEKGNNGTTSIFYCPYCGRRCQQVITKEA